MNVPTEGCLLRVFVGEGTRANGMPAYEAIVQKARALKLAGATVLRGVMGLGATSRLAFSPCRMIFPSSLRSSIRGSESNPSCRTLSPWFMTVW